MDDITINAIIQARIGSTRLPGKVLIEIEGIPILEHIINRLNVIKNINKVIVATSSMPENDVIEAFCKEKAIACVRGSEENVLERFGLVAAEYLADIYIRATGDNPIIDVNLIEDMLTFFRRKQLTYTGYRGFPLGSGVEVFSNTALMDCLKNANLPYELEHVTPYMYQRMKDRKVEYFLSQTNDSKIRMTIDTEDDLTFAKELFKRLFKNNPYFGVSDVKSLLRQEPELIKINQNIHQKVLGE